MLAVSQGPLKHSISEILHMKAGRLTKHIENVKIVVDFMEYIDANKNATFADVSKSLNAMKEKGIAVPAHMEPTLCSLRLKSIVSKLLASSDSNFEQPADRFLAVFSPFSLADVNEDSDDSDDDTPARIEAGTVATFDFLRPAVGSQCVLMVWQACRFLF